MGSAYATIFWIQNLGLMAFPMIIGWVLNKVNPGVGEAIKAGEHVSYNYTVPMLIFASLGVLAFLLAFWLKLEDRKSTTAWNCPTSRNNDNPYPRSAGKMMSKPPLQIAAGFCNKESIG